MVLQNFFLKQLVTLLLMKIEVLDWHLSIHLIDAQLSYYISTHQRYRPDIIVDCSLPKRHQHDKM